jgi:hypothetical protein
VFCSKNTCWNNLSFTRAAIEACCGLHKFLEDRSVDMPDVDDVHDELLLMPHEVADASSGIEVRAMLTEWIAEH